MKTQNLPNFIIGGGVASGTSFLSSVLMHHPDIYLPKQQRPEPNFFHYSWKFNEGFDWYLKTWFSTVAGQPAIGERSSLLLTSPYAPKRIKACLPDVKLIFCLRNPIERAWANYRFSVLEGLEPMSFESAIETEESRAASAEGRWAEVQPNAYVKRSCYSVGLQEYLQLFGKDRVLCLKSEDLSKNTEKNIKRVCEFLSVRYIPGLPLPPNFSSPSIKNPQLQASLRGHFGDRFSEIVENIRTGEHKKLDAIKEDRKQLELLQQNLYSSKEPLPSVERKLLAGKLAQEIHEVAQLVDFSVEDWI